MRPLFSVIYDTLLELDGCCLDNNEERTHVASELSAKIIKWHLDARLALLHAEDMSKDKDTFNPPASHEWFGLVPTKEPKK